MIKDEHQLLTDSLPAIRQTRGAQPLPDIPLVVFSATTGSPAPERQTWTKLQARLAASVPRGQHVVLAGTSHAVNQEKPAAIADAVNRILDDL